MPSPNLLLTPSYGGVALLMMVLAPELVVPYVGVLVSRGDLDPARALAAASLGALVPQLLFYALARGLGEERVRAFSRRRGRWLLRERDLDEALSRFARHGAALLVAGRCLPFVRSLVSVPAGLSRMSAWRFTALTLVGTALWNGVLLLGTALAQHWHLLTRTLGLYEDVVGILLGLALLAWLLRRVLGERRLPERRNS